MPEVIPSLQKIGYRCPKEGKETPFYNAQQATKFEWLKQNPVQRKYFDNYMAARRKEVLQWWDVFSVEQHLARQSVPNSDAVLLVDVGGSHGHDLLGFAKCYPSIPGKLVLEDLPETLESVASLPERIEVIAYDFFTPQPVIGISHNPPLCKTLTVNWFLDAQLYYFGTVCHDWADEYCIKFLSNTAAAMSKDSSTLLINDYVVPEMNASLREASMDLQMMTLFAGVERTESQWRKLLEASNLELVQVWRSKSGLESIIETRRNS